MFLQLSFPVDRGVPTIHQEGGGRSCQHNPHALPGSSKPRMAEAGEQHTKVVFKRGVGPG